MNANEPHPEERRRRVSKDNGVSVCEPSFETIASRSPQDEVGERKGGWSARATPRARDTIFALSTPPGRSAVAVIRLSGPKACETLAALIGKTPDARRAVFATFRDPTTGDVLDKGLALSFPGPASFTGEDAAEIQMHGSMAAVRAILSVLAQQPGLREAQPGEFTRRALDNGKLDLARAEALADLIDAQTDRQRRLAEVTAATGPSRFAEAWQDRLLDAMAAIDAELDFSDEGDVGSLVRTSLLQNIASLSAQVADAVRASERVRRVREGFVVAICGPPNSGKSTLLNALVGREQAIVSPYAGTTRDPIEVSLDLGGQLVTLVDTAGIRETSEAVERIGIDRARQEARRADLTIWLEAPDARAEPEAGMNVDLRVAAKADVEAVPAPDLSVSAISGAGIDQLIELLRDRATATIDELGDAVALRGRHVAQLGLIGVELDAACQHLKADALELASAHLRGAHDILTSIGADGADDAVLDRIFGRFCIGK